MYRGTCTPMFIAALSTIAKLWKEPKCPLTDEWIKMWVVCVYIHTYIYVCVCVYMYIHTHNGVLRGNEKE